MSQVMRVFFDVNMSLAHDGLHALARENKIKLEDLQDGQFVLFINHARNRLKLFTASNTFAYLRLPEYQVLDLDVISKIPKAFQASGRINYDQSLKETLEKKLADRQERKERPASAHTEIVKQAQKKRVA